MVNDYKSRVKADLYRRYFTKLHSSEKDLEFTSTKMCNRLILNKFLSYYASKVLDAGCGDGLFMKDALNAGFDCEGFDSNNSLLDVCRKKGFNVKYGDLSKKLPYDDASFDGVFCSNVFEHLSEPEFALHELLRVLKEGGCLVITVPEMDNKIFYNDWTHITPFTKHTFKNMMRCVDVRDYRVYRRHFPVLVKYMRNPFVSFGNSIIHKGILAEAFTWIFEKVTYTHRHDLVLEIRK